MGKLQVKFTFYIWNASAYRHTRKEAERRYGYNGRYAPYAVIAFRPACVRSDERTFDRIELRRRGALQNENSKAPRRSRADSVETLRSA